jgi:hypothetical protein
LHPRVGFGERLEAERTGSTLRIALPFDQAGTFENAEVLGYGAWCDRKGSRQFCHRCSAAPKPREQRPARRIGQRSECPV